MGCGEDSSDLVRARNHEDLFAFRLDPERIVRTAGMRLPLSFSSMNCANVTDAGTPQIR